MWPERWHPLGAQAQWEATAQRTASDHLDVAVDGVVNRFLNLWGLPAAQ